MKYTTTNELEHFEFNEAYICDMQITSGFFHMYLDNVTILPENSCNRDIRIMRANGLLLKIEDFQIDSITREGYKVYDANGKLMNTCEDEVVEEADFLDVIKSFSNGTIYSITKQENKYTFAIDAADERTYQLCISGSNDIEEWERFLNREEE